MTSPDPVACPSLGDLESFLADGSSNGAVRLHLDRCSACRQQVERINRNNAFMASLVPRVQEIPPPRSRPSLEASAKELVAGYRILSEIHRSGQGVVYRALQIATKRKVALKILSHRLSISERQRRRFEREVEVVAGLRHPNIVTVHDSGTTEDGRHFFAMELISGSTLDVYLVENKPELRSVVVLLAKVARAVQHAHQRGITHRDLKPGNVLIDSSGEPHVVDFGLAKVAGPSLAVSCAVSISGEFVGTLKYASPEQVAGDSDQIDIRTDVYSLGVVLYESLTGRLPYAIVGSITEIVRTITDAEPEPPSGVKTAIDDELETIVLMALAKDRTRRYQSAGELADDLERYLSNRVISAKRDSTWYMLKKSARRYRVHATLAAGFVLAIMVFAVFMAVQNRWVVTAEGLAQSRANELARLLTESNIERGRASARMGAISMAEDLIWTEFLNPPTGEAASALSSAADAPGSAQAYWALWELYYRSGCLATLRAYEDRVRSIDLNSAGDLLAVSGYDGMIRLRRIPGGEPLATLRDEGGSIVRATFSPDGQTILACNNSAGSVTIWNVETHEHSGRFGEGIVCACFSPDGLTIATGDTSGSVRLWDSQTRVCKSVVHEGGPSVSGVSFSPQGTTLGWATGQTVSVWDGMFVHSRVISSRFPSWTGNLYFDPEQHYLLFLQRRAVWRWEEPFTESPKPWLTHTAGRISSLASSQDGRILASGSDDWTLKLWQAATGQCSRTLAGHTSTIDSVCFAADDSTLISSSSDRTIRFWDLADGPARLLMGHSGPVHSITFSPDGTRLASCSADNDMTFRTWDWRIGRQDQIVMLPESIAIHAVAYSPDGRLLATASEDWNIRLWDTSTWECVQTLAEHGDSVNSVIFSPDGRFLASGSRDKTVKLWEVNTWTCITSFAGHAEKVAKVRFSPDSRTLASCSSDQKIILWDTVSRQARATLADHDNVVRAIAFSADGKLLASGGDNSEIRLWDSQSGDCLAMLGGHQQAIYSVAFSPDGRLLASSANSGEIKLWDVGTHQNLLTIQEATDQPVFGVAFSPDGDTLATAGSDQMIHLWDLTYYQRHIAGNLEYHVDQMLSDGGSVPKANELRAWSHSILKQP